MKRFVDASKLFGPVQMKFQTEIARRTKAVDTRPQWQDSSRTPLDLEVVVVVAAVASPELTEVAVAVVPEAAEVSWPLNAGEWAVVVDSAVLLVVVLITKCPGVEVETVECLLDFDLATVVVGMTIVLELD